MKYVLDASVAMRWVLPSPLSAKALALRDEYLNKVHDLIAPDIFPGETAGALTKAERQKIIAIGDAAILYSKDRGLVARSPVVFSVGCPGPRHLVQNEERVLRLPVRRPRRTRKLRADHGR
jgi:hypothetical protein